MRLTLTVSNFIFVTIDQAPQYSPIFHPGMKRQRSQESRSPDADDTAFDGFKKMKADETEGSLIMVDYNRHMDILTRLFPEQKRNVLELVLRGCGGDFAQAIECILPSHEEAILRGKGMLQNPVFHPLPSPFSSLGRTIAPFPPPAFPSVPIRPLCTHPNYKCFWSTCGDAFKDVKSTNRSSFPRSSFGYSQDVKNSDRYFGYRTPTFLPLPDKHTQSSKKRDLECVFSKSTMDERCDDTTLTERGHYEHC